MRYKESDKNDTHFFWLKNLWEEFMGVLFFSPIFLFVPTKTIEQQDIQSLKAILTTFPYNTGRNIYVSDVVYLKSPYKALP